MLDSLFRGVFDTQLTSVIAPADFLLCVGVSLLIGLLLSAMTMWHTRSSASFTVTLALLPAVVCVVIMMVNGNVGAGVAVSGAFGLVRFRSAPGSAREIGDVFIAMGAGLIAGMGYLGYALRHVKTTNMGSLFKLTYDLTLRDPAQEKAFIDELRCRNGNLEISVSYQDTSTNSL